MKNSKQKGRSVFRLFYKVFCSFFGAVFAVCFLFGALHLCFPLEKAGFFPPSGMQVFDEDGKALRFFLAADDCWRFETSLSEISPKLQQLVIFSEDRWFFHHFGINPFSVVRAAWLNMRSARIVSGASTVSMQLARLVRPAKRTFWAKLRESFRAVQIEFLFTKNEILDRYLNLAPFGRNIVGVGAASWFYFGKIPSQLSLGESALLVALPRSPAGYDPIRYPKRAKKIRDAILRKSLQAGLFSENEIRYALAEPLPKAYTPLPLHAPHFCELTRRFFSTSQIKTSLKFDLQAACVSRFRLHLQKIRQQGIKDGACVVLDRENGKIRAFVGSYSYFDSRHGQINAALVPRSPGSTLKPFLFARAFDLGKILPESIVFDIPVDFSGYKPKNYDDTFLGMMTAGAALASSRNVPSVRLLTDIGFEDFYVLLQKGGLRSLGKNADKYGLSFILGACEVNLLELTNLYAVLANGGEYRPWTLLGKSKPVSRLSSEECRLFSPAAAWLTNRILTQVKRSDLPKAWDLTRDMPQIAWKTGTSFGHRDAWAVGFSARHIIGVWVGNLNGEAVKGISGVSQAGPLLFDLFRAVQEKDESLALPQPTDIQEIELCALSGLRASAFCPKCKQAWAVYGVLPRYCDWHKQIFVDRKSGERLVGQCLSVFPYTEKIITVYPQEIAGWRKEQGLPIPFVPPVSPKCTQIAPGKGPFLVSPSSVTPYLLQKDVPPELQKISFIARTEADVTRLFWFVDGELMAEGSPEQVHFWVPQKGKHRLVVQDDLGRKTAITFWVE